MNLNPIIKDDEEPLWCGPAILCIVSGRPSSQINALIRSYGHDPKYTKNWLFHAILESMGYRVEFGEQWILFNEIPRNDGKLRAIIAPYQDPNDDTVSHHMFVVKDDIYMDNGLGDVGRILSLSDCVRLLSTNPWCLVYEIEETEPYPC